VGCTFPEQLAANFVNPRARSLSKFLSAPGSPRFSLRGLIWLTLFFAANCGLISVIDSRASPAMLYLAFAVDLILLGVFLVSEAGVTAIRTISLVAAASAMVAICIAFALRGRVVIKVLINGHKFATDLEMFATSPVGCTLTVSGLILLTSFAAASLRLIFSSRAKVGFLALIWLLAWLMLFDTAKENRPFVDKTGKVPSVRTIFVE
jgi:hypothetical protein